jgi:hypothetical protein
MRRTRHPAFVAPLLEALAGDDARTAAAAAGALAELGELRAIKPTITAIGRLQDAGPRDAMVGALGRLGGGDALATLLALSEPGVSAEARSRRAAIEALAQFEEPHAVDRLLGVVAADADSGYEFMEVMTSLDALGRIKISDPSQQQSAEQLLLEVSGGNHWLDQQHTRVAGQIARKAERILQQRVASD